MDKRQIASLLKIGSNLALALAIIAVLMYFLTPSIISGMVGGSPTFSELNCDGQTECPWGFGCLSLCFQARTFFFDSSIILILISIVLFVARRTLTIEMKKDG